MFWGKQHTATKTVYVFDKSSVVGLKVNGPGLSDLYDETVGRYTATVSCQDGATVEVEPEWSIEGAGWYARMSVNGELSFYDETYNIYQCATATVTAVYGGFSNSTQTVLYGPGYVTIDKYEVSQNAVWPGCTYTVTPKSVRWWRHGVLEDPTPDLSDVAFTWYLDCPGDKYRSGDGSSFTVPSDAFSTNGTCTVYIYSKPDRERYYKSYREYISPQFYASRPQMVTVTFDANGGESSFSNLLCAAGKPYGSGFLPDLIRKGYYGSWYTDRDGGAVVNTASNAPIANATVYAHWNPNYYYVTYDANGGEGEGYGHYLYYDSPATLRERTFKKEGCSFAGWALSPDGPVVYEDRQEVLNLRDSYGTVTLYAVWQKNVYATITFDANGGRIGDAERLVASAVVGQPIGELLPQPEYFGHSFAGWFTSAIGGTKIDESLRVSEAATFYARWADPVAFHELAYTNVAEAVDAALRDGKLLFVLYGADWCGVCGMVKSYIESHSNELLQDFVVYYCNGDIDSTMPSAAYPSYGTFDPASFSCDWEKGCYDMSEGWSEASFKRVVETALDAKTPDPSPVVPQPDPIRQTITLSKAGWNRVSFNVLPDNPSPEEVFADVADKMDRVVQGIRTWKPGAGGRLAKLQIGVGYWVLTTEDNVTWSIAGSPNPGVEISLSKGWNLVGYPLLESGATATVLKTALDSGKVTKIVSGASVYPGRLTTMSPGGGYWVYAPSECTITFDCD